MPCSWQSDEGHQNYHFEPILNPMGIFCNDEGDGNKNIKNSNGFNNQNNNSACAIHFLVRLFCHYCTTRTDMKFPDGMFTEDVNTRRRIFLPVCYLGYDLQEFNSRIFHLHLTFKAS